MCSLPERVPHAVGRGHGIGHKQQCELPLRRCGAMFATLVVRDRRVCVQCSALLDCDDRARSIIIYGDGRCTNTGASHHFVIPRWTVLCHLLASRMLPQSVVCLNGRVSLSHSIVYLCNVLLCSPRVRSASADSVAIAAAGSAHRLSIEIRLWSCATSRIGCKVPRVLCDVARVCFAEPDHVPMMSNICMYYLNMCCGHRDLREP